MSPWASGDTLSSDILNLRGGSASTPGGFSTNTLRAESGNTLSLGTMAFSASTFSGAIISNIIIPISGNTISDGTYAQSSGTALVAGPVWTAAGTVTSPTHAFSSETSLGWYNSGSSAMALSYGTLNLNQAFLSSLKTAASVSSASLGANAWAIANPGVSGASICININGVMYIFNSSATTIGR